jgi:hypothetical protein
MQHHMAVITHHHAGTNIDRKYLTEQQHPINDPLKAVFEVVAAVAIDAA